MRNILLKILFGLYIRINNPIVRRFIADKIKKNDGGEAFSTVLRKIYLNVYGIEVGYGTYGGCFNISNIPPNVSFGNYSSIARGVMIFRANHPTSYFTTHPIFYNPVMGVVETDKLNRPHLHVGHDVWIGANVIILPSVTNIGNGAVIGAGSVITRNVLPYSIVAGNPARQIRERFPKEVVKRIEETEWWLFSKKELTNKREVLEKIIGNV